jgi:ElaB/YqjD/DUF883 family membrane-anchored ribosome-binding protein
MAETTADVRRDIELTRERMTSTLAQLEEKLNLAQVVKDNPWPALGLALGAGFLLSGSGADVKAAEATRSLAGGAREGARTRLGPALDDALSRLMAGLSEAVNHHIDHIVADVQRMVGMPPHASGNGASSGAPNASRPLADGGATSGYTGGQNDWARESAAPEGGRAD